MVLGDNVLNPEIYHYHICPSLCSFLIGHYSSCPTNLPSQPIFLTKLEQLSCLQPIRLGAYEPNQTQLKSKSNSWVATIINKLMVQHFFWCCNCTINIGWWCGLVISYQYISIFWSQDKNTEERCHHLVPKLAQKRRWRTASESTNQLLKCW